MVLTVLPVLIRLSGFMCVAVCVCVVCLGETTTYAKGILHVCVGRGVGEGGWDGGWGGGRMICMVGRVTESNVTSSA